MPTVREDLAQSPRITEDTGRTTVTRIFRVTGLVMSKEFQLMEALNESAIPVYLDEFPFDAITPEFPQYTAIRVRERTAEPDGPNAARVTIVYTDSWDDLGGITPPPPATNDGDDVKQVRTGVTSRKTTVDRTAAEMLLSPPAGFGAWKAYRSEAEILRPTGSVVWERIERSNPTARMRTYVGKLNDATIGPYAAETLLFSDLTAVTDDAGDTWRCSYEFQYSPDGWKHKDRYHAPDGKVPEGATEVEFDVLAVADFTALGLDFAD